MKWLKSFARNLGEDAGMYLGVLLGFAIFLAFIPMSILAKPKEQTPRDFCYPHSARTITYDKCEYAVFLLKGEFFIVHKGNCNNPVHAGKTGKEDTEK